MSRSPLKAAVLAIALVIDVGCSNRRDSSTPNVSSSSGSAAQGKARISAEPNPVPAGTDQFGTTTVTWDTSDGSIGEVYVSVNGEPEKLFAGNRAKGSLEAKWIGKGEYDFRLY